MTHRMATDVIASRISIVSTTVLANKEVNNMELNDISGLPFTPSPVGGFTNRRVKYHLDQSEAVDVDLLAPTHIHTLDTANTIAIQMGTKFIESVIYIDRYWFYVTGLGVFNHQAKDIDECADNTAYEFYDKVTARITKKTTGFGSDYFEWMIAIGHIECVATRGFFGVANRNGWMGSNAFELDQ
jgi:hypothetical protein